MKRKLPVIVSGLIVILVLVLGSIVWQKSQIKEPEPAGAREAGTKTRKVDLSSQPDWVQNLQVIVTKGKSKNGLENFTFKVTGIPLNTAKTLAYTAYFDTSNRGTQGASSTEPIDLVGATEFSKTIDLGTCSATCSAFQGVKSIDLELSFGSVADKEFFWSKSLEISNN